MRGRDRGFAEGFILGFFGYMSVSLGHFYLVVLLEATNQAGSSRTPALSVSKNQRSRERKSTFLFASAQLALEGETHHDTICIDCSHSFGWFLGGICRMSSMQGAGIVDSPRASPSATSAASN